MSATTTTLTETELAQIANIEQSKHDAGLTIHEADTPYGHVFFTIESKDGGAVWTPEILTINGIDHGLIGTYLFGHEYDCDSGDWSANPNKPIAHVAGYPGVRRRDKTVWENQSPTESSAHKLAVALGHAIAPSFADPAEAEANEREMAAQAWEDKARHAEQRAEHELEQAMNYRAEAARIRQGASYGRKAA